MWKHMIHTILLPSDRIFIFFNDTSMNSQKLNMSQLSEASGYHELQGHHKWFLCFILGRGRPWPMTVCVCSALRRLNTYRLRLGCVSECSTTRQLELWDYEISQNQMRPQPLKTSDLLTSGPALHIMTVYLWSKVKFNLALTHSVLFWNTPDVLMLYLCLTDLTRSALCWIAALCTLVRQKPEALLICWPGLWLTGAVME